jgi:hypothetical protein
VRAEPGEEFAARPGKEFQMGDLIFVGMTVVFFALSILYVKGCERLK